MSDRMPCGCTVSFTAQFGLEIKYCWRHYENHALAAERRRYALLSAAAAILAGGVYVLDGENEPRNWESHETATKAAVSLLFEIEKLEKS